MLFSRYFLWEDAETKTFNDLPIRVPQLESKSEESDLTVSLISQDSYTNRDRELKLAKIRELQSELSQYTHYINSANFLFFLRKAIIRIHEITVEAFSEGSDVNFLKDKINEVGNVYGIQFKFKNFTQPELLLKEIIEEHQMIHQLYKSSYDGIPLCMAKRDKLRTEISTLIAQFKQHHAAEEAYTPAFPPFHW